MFKKSISIMLSIAIFLSAISINFNISRKTVEAGTTIPTFNAFFDPSLVENYNNGVPAYNGSNTDSESALFTFSMDRDPRNAQFVQGTYKLSYPVKDNTLLEMTVDKDDASSATITYQFTNAAGVPIDLTETVTRSDFTIFSYRNGSYESQAAFSSNGSVASGNYVVTKKTFDPADARDNGGTPNTPVFHIKAGSGFSFEYGGIYAHIKWDDATQEFQFFTDGLNNGNIYDVKLDFTSSDGIYTNSDNIKVFTGMSLSTGRYQGDGLIADKFIAAPFANDTHFENDIVYSSTNDIPGDPTNGIQFGLTAPYEWDGSAYAKVASSSDYDMNIKMEMGGRQITVSDVLGALKVDVSGNDPSTYTPKVVQNINSKGQFYFSLSNLPIGVVYENIIITPEIFTPGTKNSAVQYKSSEVPFGQVFTFPNFKVVQINSQFYVQLEPFKTFDGQTKIKGTYLLKTDDRPSVTQWSEGDASVYFPLPINAATSPGATYKYQVFFNPLTFFEDINKIYYYDYMHTEQYQYVVPTEKGDLSNPDNFVVNDYNLSSKPGVDRKTEMILSLDLSFDVAKKTQLEKMLADSSTGEVNVKYVLSNYLTPSASDINKQDYTYVNLRIYKGDYTDPLTGNVTTDAVLVDYTFSYNSDMSDPYKTLNGQLLKSTYRSDASTDMYYADFDFDLRASRDEATPANPTNPPIYFEYPNIYFLTVNTYELDRGDGQGYVSSIGGSTFESITLNDVTDKEVPPPQSLEIQNVTNKSFDIEWLLSGEGLKEYLADIYTTSELQDIADNIGDDGNGTNNLDAYYNVYIGTSESFMNNTFSKYPLPDTLNTGTPTRTGTSYVINSKNLSNPYNLYASDYTYTDESGNTITNTADSNGTSTLPIDILRKTNGIVMVSHYPIYNEQLSTGDYNADTYTALQDVYSAKTNIANMLSVYGLDKNKKYYVYLDLVVENQETLTSRVVKSSMLSPLVGETTLSDIDVPEDKYKVPPSPVLSLINTAVDSVKLGWSAVVVTDSSGNKSQIEYDILRLQGSQLDDKYLTTKDSFSTTWENYLPTKLNDKKGYRTNILDKDQNILEYDEKTKTFVATDDATLDSSVISFLDNGLDPNKVYFYYVRSVRVTTDTDGNEILVYSNWSKISATTKNVQSPTNLIINTIYPNYDPKTEVVLNFDAPIIDTSKIGVAYDLYYSVKEDGGNWSEPILMDPATLRSGATGTTDTVTNFNYKISKLKNGTSYTFRVRMHDRTTGANSLYSNEAKAKTDIDQDDYDNDKEIGNWEDFILDKLQEMMNENYWVINETYGQKDVVYREEKFPSIINSTTNSFVTLIPAKDTAINNYYIPAKSYDLLNNSGLGLKILYKNTEFYLTPKALSDALSAAKKDVEKNNIKDYYIKISVSGYASGAINGESCLSDVMTFDIVTTGFETTAKAFEKEAYNELLSLLTDNENIEELIEDITKYVEDGKSDLEIQELVYAALPDIKEDLLKEINTNFVDYLAGSKYNNKITRLDGQLAVSLLNVSSDTNANAYYRVNENWLLKNVLSFGNARTFTTSDIGIFVFTGKILTLPGLDNLVYGNTIKDLFIKYGLDAYLGSGNTFNASQKLTGQMVMGTSAKLMGMTSLEDPVTFLKAKNINASERVSRNNVKGGDMIYYLMKVYENRTGTNIENINITNYAATSNMKGLTSQNKKSVQMAAQIGLVRDPKFNANYEMTVKDFLYYLNRLNELTSL